MEHAQFICLQGETAPLTKNMNTKTRTGKKAPKLLGKPTRLGHIRLNHRACDTSNAMRLSWAGTATFPPRQGKRTRNKRN